LRLKNTRLYYITVFVVILLLTGCSNNNYFKDTPQNSISTTSETPEEGLNIGNIAPNFEIQLDGKVIKLSDLKGKPVFLNFWATWCSYCKIEMPTIEQMYQEGHSVQILAVNVKESPMRVRSFMAKEGYTFPIGYDLKGEIANLYMATGLPTSYGIDANGIIRYKIQGVISNAQLQEWVNGLEH